MKLPHHVGAGIMARIGDLAVLSESPGGLTRRYLTTEHRQANELVGGWMRDAGMNVHQDAIGNIVGRYEGVSESLPALIIGSHLDTVVMAGRYDGMLGVLTGIACVQSLCERGIRLPFAVEVVGFADEEGARFQSTYLGSRALAGTFDTTLLERRDGDGTSMAEALRAFGLDPGRIGDAARKPEDVAAYLELHIEQGPVLESEGLAVGVVTAIAGATRLVVTVAGVAGHAGTVPMALRQDALMAASECVLAVEKVAAARSNGVGTVGRMRVEPGATNVIPGKVTFSVDLRAAEDEPRKAAVAELDSRLREIAARRSVDVSVETVHEAASVTCAPRIVEQIDQAIEEQGERVFRLPSGAGHDAAAMADITDVGMIFLRCKGGISHNPDESITQDDASVGTSLLLKIIENFKLKT
jgi:allantoate deiminase